MTQREQVAHRAKALQGGWADSIAKHENRSLNDYFEGIARAELEREQRLLTAVDDGIGIVGCAAENHDSIWAAKIRLQMHRDKVRAAYEAEFAPPQRTVEQIARDVDAQRVRGMTVGQGDGSYALVPRELMDELAEALKAKGGAK